MAPGPLESVTATPIAQLSPDLVNSSSRTVRGVVAIIWPYNSVSRSLGFLLAESDPLLRRANGQVRIQLHGSSAETVAKLDIGGGDEVILSLEGVKWTIDDKRASLRSTGIEWQLQFSERLVLQVKLGDTQGFETIDIDHPTPNESCFLTPEDPGPDKINWFAQGPSVPDQLPKVPSNKETNDYEASPAFIKRARESYGALFEGGFNIFEDDGGVKGRGRKRTRFGRESEAWRYSSQSRSPEPASRESSLPLGEGLVSDERTPPSARPQMMDEGCQTIESDIPSTPIQKGDSRRLPSPSQNQPTTLHPTPPTYSNPQKHNLMLAGPAPTSPGDFPMTNISTEDGLYPPTPLPGQTRSAQHPGVALDASYQAPGGFYAKPQPPFANMGQGGPTWQHQSVGPDDYPEAYLRPLEIPSNMYNVRPTTSGQVGEGQSAYSDGSQGLEEYRMPPEDHRPLVYPITAPSLDFQHAEGRLASSPISQVVRDDIDLEDGRDDFSEEEDEAGEPARSETDQAYGEPVNIALDEPEGYDSDVAEEEEEYPQNGELGGDYDIRNFADVEDDEEGFGSDLEEDFSGDEMNYEEEEDYSDDDDDEGRESGDEEAYDQAGYGSMHIAPRVPGPTTQGPPEVIDLISDSEHEDQQAAAPSQSNQRGASDSNAEDEHVEAEMESGGSLYGEDASVDGVNNGTQVIDFAAANGKASRPWVQGNGEQPQSHEAGSPVKTHVNESTDNTLHKQSNTWEEANSDPFDNQPNAHKPSAFAEYSVLATSTIHDGTKSADNGVHFALETTPSTQEGKASELNTDKADRHGITSELQGLSSSPDGAMHQDVGNCLDKDTLMENEAQDDDEIQSQPPMDEDMAFATSSSPQPQNHFADGEQSGVVGQLRKNGTTLSSPPLTQQFESQIVDEKFDIQISSQVSATTVKDADQLPTPRETQNVASLTGSFTNETLSVDLVIEETSVTTHVTKSSLQMTEADAMEVDTEDAMDGRLTQVSEDLDGVHDALEPELSQIGDEDVLTGADEGRTHLPPPEEATTNPRKEDEDAFDQAEPIQSTPTVEDGIHDVLEPEDSESQPETASSGLEEDEDMTFLMPVENSTNLADPAKTGPQGELRQDEPQLDAPIEVSGEEVEHHEKPGSSEAAEEKDDAPSQPSTVVYRSPDEGMDDAPAPEMNKLKDGLDSSKLSGDEDNSSQSRIANLTDHDGTHKDDTSGPVTRSHQSLEAVDIHDILVPELGTSHHGSADERLKPDHQTSAGASRDEQDEEAVQDAVGVVDADKDEREPSIESGKQQGHQSTEPGGDVVKATQDLHDGAARGEKSEGKIKKAQEIITVKPGKKPRRSVAAASLKDPSMPPPEVDPSIQFARAALASKRGKRQSEVTVDLPLSPRATRATSRSIQKSATPEPDEDSSIQLAKDALKSPSRPEEFNTATSAKAKLLKRLRTELPDFTTLKILRNHNNKVVDVVAIATTQPPEPQRAKGGPREYMMSFNMTDPSTAPTQVIEVQIYRPHKDALPIVKPGFAVLMRGFTILSLKNKGFGLRSADGSSWAVWDQDDGSAQIRGPPVEISDVEAAYANDLRAWYGLLDDTTGAKIERANQKMAEANGAK